MREIVAGKLKEVFVRIFPDVLILESEIEIIYPPEEFGDYSTNLALKVAKSLKKNPREIAELIKKELEKDNEEENIFSKIEVAGAGFLNFYLSSQSFERQILEIKNKKENFGNSEIGKGVKVNNEFISANPTGPLHLGNGRGGFFGDALSKVLRKAGFEVVNEYYVNDAGEQTLKLAHSFKKDSQTVYTGEYIEELRKRHKEIIDMEVAPSAAPLANAILEEYIIPAVEKMEVEFDEWFSEKSLYDDGFVDKAIDRLKGKGVIFEQDGALWLKTTEFGDDKDRVLVKTDGQKTYFASDCGYILNKIERGFGKIIEIWGADHHGYTPRFQAAAKALGFRGELKFIIVQLVRLIKDGKEARMSKRAGNVVYIDELISEVGHDAARFFFLMYSPDAHMNFDLELAKEKSNKNPVYYVQYACARMSGILGKTKDLEKEKADFSLLVSEKEIELIRHLMRFPDLISEIARSYEVHKLTHYAIKLADKFHSFYHVCRILDEEKNLAAARRELVSATKIVLSEALRLIGVSAPEKM